MRVLVADLLAAIDKRLEDLGYGDPTLARAETLRAVALATGNPDVILAWGRTELGRQMEGVEDTDVGDIAF